MLYGSSSDRYGDPLSRLAQSNLLYYGVGLRTTTKSEGVSLRSNTGLTKI